MQKRSASAILRLDDLYSRRMAEASLGEEKKAASRGLLELKIRSSRRNKNASRGQFSFALRAPEGLVLFARLSFLASGERELKYIKTCITGAAITASVALVGNNTFPRCPFVFSVLIRHTPPLTYMR
jgi:hypothetical protein